MGDLGAITEIVNSDELTLLVGADTYILLKDLQIKVGRTENRVATTDAGPIYTYGKGDNWFSATLVVSTPELSSLNTLTQTDGNGAMTSTSWLIKANNVTGAAKTFAATGVLRDYQVRKQNQGEAVEIDIFVRITGDTVTIS